MTTKEIRQTYLGQMCDIIGVHETDEDSYVGRVNVQLNHKHVFLTDNIADLDDEYKLNAIFENLWPEDEYPELMYALYDWKYKMLYLNISTTKGGWTRCAG